MTFSTVSRRQKTHIKTSHQTNSDIMKSYRTLPRCRPNNTATIQTAMKNSAVKIARCLTLPKTRDRSSDSANDDFAGRSCPPASRMGGVLHRQPDSSQHQKHQNPSRLTHFPKPHHSQTSFSIGKKKKSSQQSHFHTTPNRQTSTQPSPPRTFFLFPISPLSSPVRQSRILRRRSRAFLH